MSVTASKPYPTLCPWLSIEPLGCGVRVRYVIEHEGETRALEVEPRHDFADAFEQALRVKREMKVAHDVWKELHD